MIHLRKLISALLALVMVTPISAFASSTSLSLEPDLGTAAVTTIVDNRPVGYDSPVPETLSLGLAGLQLDYSGSNVTVNLTVRVSNISADISSLYARQDTENLDEYTPQLGDTVTTLDASMSDTMTLDLPPVMMSATTGSASLWSALMLYNVRDAATSVYRTTIIHTKTDKLSTSLNSATGKLTVTAPGSSSAEYYYYYEEDGSPSTGLLSINGGQTAEISTSLHTAGKTGRLYAITESFAAKQLTVSVNRQDLSSTDFKVAPVFTGSFMKPTSRMTVTR
jgi:hypothetical protein